MCSSDLSINWILDENQKRKWNLPEVKDIVEVLRENTLRDHEEMITKDYLYWSQILEGLKYK